MTSAPTVAHAVGRYMFSSFMEDKENPLAYQLLAAAEKEKEEERAAAQRARDEENRREAERQLEAEKREAERAAKQSSGKSSDRR